jgi:Cu(I)/Ag(I) efflux system membrane fusion protein
VKEDAMRVRRIACLVLLFVGAWACGGSRSEPVVVRSEGVELEVSVEPAVLRVGSNALLLALRDSEGEPVTDAAVEVEVRMHAMGAMPAMGGPAAVRELGPGRYRADFELGMGGTWKLAIAARQEGGPVARAEGALTVGSGVQLEGVGRAATPAASQAQAESAAEHAHAETHPAEFQFDPGRLQRVGVRSAPALRKTLETSIRAVGRVVAEEATLADVAPKVRGWVGTLEVGAVGDPVERGQVLFGVYSPELHAAQQEYLQALRSQERARATSAPERADHLVRAARNRLRLWDIADADLDQLARRGEPFEHLPIRSPVTGYVVEKNLVAGSAFEPGARLYRIAPLSRVWVEAEVYEYELPLVHAGQAATLTLPYLPERSFEASVTYVYPTLDPRTRTARLRLELPNPDLALRPDMYANVVLRVDRGERLVVPQSAVLHAGERSFVFRALGEGRFRPQAVEIGLRSGEDVEVLSGLEPGDEVVTSGTFLIASESRLRAALEQW